VQWLKQHGYNAKTSFVVLARCSCIVSKPRRPQMAPPASVTAAKTMMPAPSPSAESALATFRSFDHLSAPSSGLESPVPFLGTTRGMVSYQPPAARQTRSQITKTPHAVAKDLISRLETIPIGEAEAILARQTRKHQPDCSLLSYLQDPGHGMTAALAATSLLEELADGVEEVSTSTALVVRYVQAHRLWEDHPNPTIDSLETLLGTVDGIQYIQAAAVVGTSSQFMRARTVVLIEQHWGPTWFEQIPADMKDPTWTRACDCSHQLLRLVAANAKQGLTFRDACRGWAESISRRRDERVRKEMRMRCPRSPFIIPEDVRSLNNIVDPAQQGRRTTEVFYPNEPAEDQLKVELVPPSAKRNYSEFGPTRGCKRKRQGNGQCGDRVVDVNPEVTSETGATNDGWRPSKNGKWLLKRVGKQMLRKPVESGDERTDASMRRDPSTESVSSLGGSVASSRDGTPDGNRELQVVMCSLPKPATDGTETGLSPTEKPTDKSKCEGRRVAALLRHLVDALSTETAETPSMVEIAGRCCDTCRTDVAKLDGLVGDFTRIARSLESVSQHRLAGVDIGWSQPPGVAPSTPHRERRQHHWLPVADSDDD
jgi:hypothetical protein